MTVHYSDISFLNLIIFTVLVFLYMLILYNCLYILKEQEVKDLIKIVKLKLKLIL